MKVYELIEQLQDCNQMADVVVELWEDNGERSYTYELEVCEVYPLLETDRNSTDKVKIAL